MTLKRRGASRPEPLGKALEEWLARSGLRKRLDVSQVVDRWPDVVGPQVAQVTRAEAVNAEGTLWVRVATSAWASELSLMAPRILARLNQGRTGHIKEIRWLTGLPAAPEPRTKE
jgi:predicted nucleic acid-binding Zn ribbon protein